MEMIYTVFSPLLTLSGIFLGIFELAHIWNNKSDKKDKTMKYWKVLVAAAMVFTLSSCGAAVMAMTRRIHLPSSGNPRFAGDLGLHPTTWRERSALGAIKVTDKQGKGYELGTTLPPSPWPR